MSLFTFSSFTDEHRSLKHELFEVVMQDGVLDVSEHQPDVLRVDGCGEVVIQWLLGGVTSLGPEAFYHERLDVRQTVLWPIVVRKVVLKWNNLHLLFQQVSFVEEKDDGDVNKNTVVHNGLKYVKRFTQSIGLPVLHQHLSDRRKVNTC